MRTSSLILSALVAAFTSVQQAFALNAHHSDSCIIGYCTAGGGTNGGSGSTSTTTVSSLAALRTAVADDVSKVVIVHGTITGNEAVLVGSNKSLLGASGGATLVGVGLLVLDTHNVIIRNLNIKKCLEMDAIGIQSSTNVWVDHVEVSADLDHDPDYYDGLIDITHGSDFITITDVNFHDNWKGSLIGNSDNNDAEDTGHLRVSYYRCHFKNINSRAPTIRFGQAHVVNSWYETSELAPSARVGGVLRIDGSYFDAGFSCHSAYSSTGAVYIDGVLCGSSAVYVPYIYTGSSTASGIPAMVAALEGPILTWV